ncbi:MAG TPA: hypothetical protein DEZ27_12725 [Sphaerochaeta sp.]|nr:hypothetical protein [Sphaerochaeta sp.]
MAIGVDMEIGLSSYSYRWAILSKKMDLRGFLDRSLSMDLSCVQICENLPFHLVSPAERMAIRDEYASRLRIETGFRGHDPKQLQRALEATAELGGTMMRLVVEEVDEEELDIDKAIADLKSVIPLLDKLRIDLSLENHFVLKPVDLVAILKALDSPRVSICFDCFNSIVQNIGTYQALEDVVQHISRIHVKDVQIRRVGTGFLISGCPMGEGILELETVQAILATHGKAPSYYLEGWIDQLETEEETLAFEDKVNNDGINYLRRNIK